jgi:hypothetical protein
MPYTFHHEKSGDRQYGNIGKMKWFYGVPFPGIISLSALAVIHDYEVLPLI